MGSSTSSFNLEDFWGDMLSRDVHRIRAAYQTLSEEESAALVEHLKRLRDEEGWHPEQRQSAIAALEAIEKWDDNN